MKILVTYKSKTGYTRMYSEIIAEELNCTLMDLRKVTAEKMSAFDLVIFGGGLYRGRINGLKKAKEMLNRSTAKNWLFSQQVPHQMPKRKLLKESGKTI